MAVQDLKSFFSRADAIELINNNDFDGIYDLFSVYKEINPTDLHIWDLTNIFIKAKVNFLEHLNNIPNSCFRTLKFQNSKDPNYTLSVIPKNIKKIDDCAFMDCSELEWIEIHFEKELSIGNYALSGCSNLKTIYFDGIKQQWDSIIFAKFWNVGLPNNVSLVCADGTYKLR